MELVRCTVNEISIRFDEFGQRIGKGGTVDLDRVVGRQPAQGDEPAREITVRDLLRGREECFEPASGSPSAEQAPTPLDVDDEDAQ